MAEAEGVVAEKEEGSSLNPEIQSQKAHERAQEKGWKPLEEYDGDPADWVDAKEFLGRQKLYDRINDLKSTVSKQTRAFQQDMNSVLQNMSKVREQEFKKAVNLLEKQRKDAAEAGDVDAVVSVSKEIETLKEEKAEEKASVKEAATTTGEATPELLEWQATNPWFQKNSEARTDAINIGVGHAANNPNKTQMEVLQYVTKSIKRMYPEEFESGKKKVDNKVENGGTVGRKPAGSTNKLSFVDLPEEHQVIGRTIIKSGALKKLAEKNKRTEQDEYIAQYQATL